jgi:hypothetical protein
MPPAKSPLLPKTPSSRHHCDDGSVDVDAPFFAAFLPEANEPAEANSGEPIIDIFIEPKKMPGAIFQINIATLHGLVSDQFSCLVGPV